MFLPKYSCLIISAEEYGLDNLTIHVRLAALSSALLPEEEGGSGIVHLIPKHPTRVDLPGLWRVSPHRHIPNRRPWASQRRFG